MDRILSARSATYQVVYETARQVARRDPGVRAEADDIANDVVVSLAAKEKSQPGFTPDNPAAWARTAAKHRIIDIKRYRMRRAAGQAVSSPELASQESDHSGREEDVMVLRRGAVATALAGIDVQHGSQEAVNDVLVGQALQRLDWNKREFLLMALVAQGFSADEIADRMGYKNAGSVRTMVARLRQEARAVLGDPGDWLGHQRPY